MLPPTVEGTSPPMTRQSVMLRAAVRPRALLILIAVMLGLWTVWSTAILPRLPPTTGLLHTVQSMGVRLLFWVLPCAVYLWVTQGRHAWRIIRLGPPPTVRRLLSSLLLVLTAAIAVSIDVADKLGTSIPNTWLRLGAEGRFEGFQTPFFEELVFRGVIFSELLILSGLDDTAQPLPLATRLKRAWLANFAASLVFVGMHWPWWIFTGGLGLGLLEQSLPVFLLSLVLGVVFARGQSLWPCVLLHWLNNSLAQLAGS